MLYIFHVEKGRMMNFEMNIALCKVIELKRKICEDTKIPVDKQVLILSGGIGLYNEEFVCHYNGGTDTNPIFLFNILSIERYGDDTELDVENAEIRALENHVREQVELSARQPACANAVIGRAALGQEIYEWSRTQSNHAKITVLHQHLQQQGWGAVVANLEDILISLSKQSESFNRSMEEYLKIRDEKIALFEMLETDFVLLKKIPLLPSLQHSSLQQCVVNLGSHEHLATRYDDMNTTSESDKNLSAGESRLKSLFDWMNEDNLNDQLDIMKTRIAGLSPQLYKQCTMEFHHIYSEIKPDMKEIKGLGDRLSQLDILLRSGEKYLEDQKLVAESFLKNKTGSFRDDTIYPSLCESQIHYLRKMLDNFLKISDINKRCSKAKYELSSNIASRLCWILYIENKVKEMSSKIEIYAETLKKVMRHVKLLEQIHNAPKLYFTSISEVIRRQKFSKGQLKWTSKLSVESREIYDKEVQTRKEFSSQLATHFLCTLFPGLNNDSIPAFATEKPKSFDEYLPQLSQQSLNILRESVPELSHILNVEEPVAIPPIIETGLYGRNNINTLMPSFHGKEVASTEFFSSAITSSMKGSLMLPLETTDERSGSSKGQSSSRPSSLIRDQPESETDTEEFEKVCGSISDGTCSPMLELGDSRKVTGSARSFTSQVSDSKHIKLDSSHQVRERRQPTTRAELETSAHRKSASPSDVISSPVSHPSPEEFERPEYYIDESMPSSCTDSTCTTTGTTTTANSGATRQQHVYQARGQVPVQTLRATIVDLRKQVEEKDLFNLSLQNELVDSRTQIEALQSRLNTLSKLSCNTVLKDLRQEMENLKGQVRDDGTNYVQYISELSTRLSECLERIQRDAETSQQVAVNSALSLAQMEEDLKRSTLQAQLIDTCRELEIYQGQTREYITQIDRLKASQKEERIQLIVEKDETVKKLTLEHELEMEALKEQWHNGEKDRVDEVSLLRENLTKLENLLTETRLEKTNLTKTIEDKFEENYRKKEESIRQILGAAYIEHEKRSLELQKQELNDAFSNEKLRIEGEHIKEMSLRIEELKTTFQIESEKRLAKEQNEMEKRHLEDIQKCQELWEAQKEEKIEEKKEQLKATLKAEYDQKLETAKLQYKMDLESLRSRFRMMTTASMDKSPSETSLEKFERGEFVDSVYHDAIMTKIREELLEEKEKALDELRKNLEEKHSLALQGERASNGEKRKEEIRILETEKQEILKEISQDKERVIEDLRLRVEFLTEETEKLRKINARAQEEARAMILPPNLQDWQEQIEFYKKEVDRLNKEAQRAKRLSFVSEKHPDLFPEEGSASSSSAGSDVQGFEGTMQKLQQENRDFRNALARTCSERKRVCMDDAQIHDVVLVVFDDIYMQYRILLENNPILHFLHSDSYDALGLERVGFGKPDKAYLTAQVTKKKEFCQAKRDGNRFRVPRGTKFYRVSAGPLYTPEERPESGLLSKAPSEKDSSIDEGAVSDLNDAKSSLGSI